MNTIEKTNLQEERYNLKVEREKLQANMEMLRRLADQASALSAELERLFEETRVNTLSAQSLEGEINCMAKKLGVKPLSRKRRKH
ncbi:MAG: hypothetical protein QM730_09740 [Anaerolineales bacterium]